MSNPEYSMERMNRSMPPCINTLGQGRVVAFDNEAGAIDMLFTVGPQHCHSENIVQGGFITGMMDAAMAQAVMMRVGFDYWIASLELKVSFISQGNPGELRARAWIRKQGRSIVFLEGELLNDESRELIATSSSTIKLIKNTGSSGG